MEGETASDPEALGAFVDTIAGTENVATAFPTPINDSLALVIVNPESAPQDAETTSLVNHLRDDVIPASGVDAQVGGLTAASTDFADYMGDRMPLLIGVVLLLSFLLLMAVFRSLLVPLKAVVMNLLSIGAAYGIIVAIFQWGWLKDVVGVDRSGPIEAWVPMFMFAIVFGLSMDYEVFLLSRIREEYDRTKDNAVAVADGLASTARVITAAALIMFCVFGAFALGDDRQLKLFGLGLGIAVLLDATIVRMILVPATMELLGDRNWWLPKWLDRILPNIKVEGEHHVAPVARPRARGRAGNRAGQLSRRRDRAAVAPSCLDTAPLDPVAKEAHGQATGRRRVARRRPRRSRSSSAATSTCAPRSATSPTCRRRGWRSTSTTASSRRTS